MCGIAGIASKESTRAIEGMIDTLGHRGPDERGVYRDHRIAIGQCRLSIIDLANGRQPISNESGTIILVCNGEIYNSPRLRKELEGKGHSFKTTTDVEVILHLYEEFRNDCVKYLRGMFAFAIWDGDTGTLFLARDHLGQKPLFVYHDKDAFLFSSEVKGILASGMIEPEVDLDGLWHYISLRYIPDRYSLFKGIQKLPAAHCLEWRDGKMEIWRYWKLDFSKKLSLSEDDIVDGLEELLLSTVKSHLLSDVRVGAFLSGGIDSGIVSAMMATLNGERVPTFSIGVKEQSFNELPYARIVTDRYGMEAHERVVEADIINLIPSMIYHMDEPSDPFGVGVYLVSKVARECVKVVLGGDGGDENFAGYDRFAGNKMADLFAVFPRWLRIHLFRRLINKIPESFQYKSFALKAQWINEMSLYEGGERYAQSLCFLRFTQEAKEKLFTGEALNRVSDRDTFSKILEYFDGENVDDLVDRMLYTDLMTRMPDHLLTVVDRMAMAHSLETRSPLIDYKVVEYAASLPSDYKLRGKTLKYILKKVASRYLPGELIERKKQGFGFPIGMWMRNELSPFMKSLFSQSRFVELGIFQGEYVRSLLEEHLEGKANHDFRLWVLLNLEIWYRIYFENESPETMRDFIQSLAKR